MQCLNGFGGGWMMILWWLLIFVIGYGFFQFFRANQQQKLNSEESPLEILKKRYAGGEISKTEFEQKKAELEN
ncbi:SHOCT domain-containing protein [bacterium]|jgi:putative membrane protein|nr:SHOCT domain-containing protein [bacterium]